MPRIAKKSKWTAAYAAGYHAGYKSELRKIEGKETRRSVVKKVKTADYKRGELNGRNAARKGKKKKNRG